MRAQLYMPFQQAASEIELTVQGGMQVRSILLSFKR